MNETHNKSIQPTAIVLNLGTELAQGFVANSNAQWLAESFRSYGLKLLWQVTLPDQENLFQQQFRLALQEAPDLLLLTGGLGPTDDDMTRSLVANGLGVSLEFRSEAEDQIRAYFSTRNRIWNDANRVQAYVPQGALLIENTFGTAPGFLILHNNIRIVCLPGVPFEMRKMFETLMQTWRAEHPTAQKLMHLDALYSGIGEATLGSQLRSCQFPQGVSWCSLPTPEGVLIRFHQVSSNASMLQDALRILLEQQGDIGTQALVSKDGSGLVRTVLRLLALGKQTVSTAESCTGGMIGELLTAIPGASVSYMGGVIAYANSVKELMLHIPHDVLQREGAVSEAVVSLMAENVKLRLGSTWGLATSGIAGPDGGSAEKPVGTVWMAISGPEGTHAFCEVFQGDRDEIRIRSVYRLMNTFRKYVMSVQKITCSFEQ
jgi:nicotinamide-nucleotide amidase